MARVPQSEIDRLKNEISLERLVQARGIELKPHGKDLIGACPFHNDKTPSFVVSPTNLWHCLGACQAGGSVIDFVMKVEGVNFRHAVEILRAGEDLAGPARLTKRRTVPKLSSPVDVTADDYKLLDQVLTYYTSTLKESPEALTYLKSRGLTDPELIDRFRLGFANRTLGLRLPANNRQAGHEIRSRLQALGVLRESGHEHFNGSLVIPILDDLGRVQGLYGRKITSGLRAGTPDHLYLPGPHRGVFNVRAVAAYREVILCEALIDALTFLDAGFPNVTSSYGVEGFTAQHLESFRRYKTRRVLIAYDRDNAGNAAAEKLTVTLTEAGIECFRIQFPRGMDANAYALSTRPAHKALELVIRNAIWVGKGKAPERPHMVLMTEEESRKQDALEEANRTRALEPSGESPTPPSASMRRPEPELNPPAGTPVSLKDVGPLELGDESQVPLDLLFGAPAAPVSRSPAPPSPDSRAGREAAAKPQSPAVPAPPPPPLPASPVPGAPMKSPKPEREGRDVTLVLGDRHYRIRGLEKNMSHDLMKVNLMLTREERFHVDVLNLYLSVQRDRFIREAVREVDIAEDVIRKDLGHLLRGLEELQAEQIEEALAPKKVAVVVPPEEEAACLELLKDPRLLDRILEDFETCGVVGEEVNKLVGYLAAVSRIQDNPLAVVIQSSSAAGKSSLMEAILAFVPEEDRVKYSAMTGQSLFYMGDADIKHKVLAIVEEEGAERASYALKLLQSEGELSIASTGKDPTSGRHVTHEYRVEGPVMIFLTTTAVEMDEELLNRCLVLSVDEDREQTRQIHRMQREAETFEGFVNRRKIAGVLKRHRNAQRLLRRLAVFNPYARRLTFRDDLTRTRRDNKKYLALIRSVTLLHQYQRPVQKRVVEGEWIDSIDVTVDDIRKANRLANEVLGRTLDELSPQTRRLLHQLDTWTTRECERVQMTRADFRFSRSEVRLMTGWSESYLRKHLDQLERFEYLILHRGGRGQSFVYEILYNGQGQDGRPFLMGLIDPDELEKGQGYDGNFAQEKEEFAHESGEFAQGSHGEYTGFARGSRAPQDLVEGAPEADSQDPPSRPTKNAVLDLPPPVVSNRPSYPQGTQPAAGRDRPHNGTRRTP